MLPNISLEVDVDEQYIAMAQYIDVCITALSGFLIATFISLSLSISVASRQQNDDLDDT